MAGWLHIIYCQTNSSDPGDAIVSLGVSYVFTNALHWETVSSNGGTGKKEWHTRGENKNRKRKISKGKHFIRHSHKKSDFLFFTLDMTMVIRTCSKGFLFFTKGPVCVVLQPLTMRVTLRARRFARSSSPAGSMSAVIPEK